VRLNRATPALPVGAMQTFAIRRPRGARLLWDKVADCAAAGCAAHLYGWVTRVDESTELGRRQAAYLRRCGRTFVEAREAALTAFTFAPGQQCFAATHEVPTEAEPLYVVRGGDWRGNPTGERRIHRNGVEWVEEFGEHQQDIADRIARG
jgi:hypothetical protein